jgi:hypothetical protein
MPRWRTLLDSASASVLICGMSCEQEARNPAHGLVRAEAPAGIVEGA